VKVELRTTDPLLKLSVVNKKCEKRKKEKIVNEKQIL